MAPNDRKYTESHEWIKIEDALAVIGISDHAQQALGDMTFIDPGATGKRLKRGEECAVLESVKAASEVYAPVDGVIAATNDALQAAPELINSDPYGAGWIVKLKDFDCAQLEALMDAAAYDTFAG